MPNIDRQILSILNSSHVAISTREIAERAEPSPSLGAILVRLLVFKGEAIVRCLNSETRPFRWQITSVGRVSYRARRKARKQSAKGHDRLETESLVPHDGPI